MEWRILFAGCAAVLLVGLALLGTGVYYSVGVIKAATYQPPQCDPRSQDCIMAIEYWAEGQFLGVCAVRDSHGVLYGKDGCNPPGDYSEYGQYPWGSLASICPELQDAIELEQLIREWQTSPDPLSIDMEGRA